MANPIKDTPVLTGQDARRLKKAMKENETKTISAKELARILQAQQTMHVVDKKDILSSIEKILTRKLKFPSTVRVADIFDAYDLRNTTFEAIVLTETGHKWNFCDSGTLQFFTPFKRCLVSRTDETLVLTYSVWDQSEKNNPYVSICDPSLLNQLKKTNA